jgi:hypothetical protein
MKLHQLYYSIGKEVTSTFTCMELIAKGNLSLFQSYEKYDKSD